jgi:cytochrome c peroxidase
MRRYISLICMVGLVACGEPAAPNYVWNLPVGFPEPSVPNVNPMSDAKVELGRHLFYDNRLSVNRTTSCSSCHLPRFAFADDKIVATGATGMALPRNSPSLQNVAYASTFTWSNPVLVSLEKQILVPLFGEFPIEMGMHLDLAAVFDRINAEPVYQSLFVDAFGNGRDAISKGNVVLALASFVRSMISGNSAWDKFQYAADINAISDSAKRGSEMFFSEKFECYHCHAGLNLTNAFRSKDTPAIAVAFDNDGLYNIGGTNSYPANNRGLIEFTQDPRDEGLFRIPSLRNVMLTPPYMHDGSMATIDDVIDMYARGGRLVTSGPFAGDGATNRNKSSFVRGFTITAQQREDLKAFLSAQSDGSYGSDPRFANPWQ